MKYAHLTRSRQFCCAFVALTSGCGYTNADEGDPCAMGPTAVVTSEQAVFGGDASCEVLGGWQDAVGVLLVRAELEGEETVATCTLSRIHSGLALTAKHCFPESERFRASVGYGPVVGDASACARAAGDAAVTSVEFHPTADLAVVRYTEVSEAPALSIATAEPVHAGSAIIAGYGLTEEGTLNARRCVMTQLKRVDIMYVTEAADGNQGACAGDSGGPLLQFGETGQPLLYGVLSEGSATCVGTDRYVPLVRLGSWLDATTGAIPH